MQKRTKKILNIALNVVIGIVCVMILLLAVSTISNRNKGYNSILGYSLYAVKSDSMKGDAKDSFDKGALVISKVLKTDSEKKGLNKGDVITFKDLTADRKDFINTHRIVEVVANGDVYITKGDNSPANDPDTIYKDVIGVYKFHINKVGDAILFVQSTTGFLIVVVVPSLLIVVYALYNLFRAYSGYSKAKAAAEMEQRLLQERARDQAKHDANKLAEEQAQKAAEQAQAEKEAQLRAELEAKIKAELEAEKAAKAEEKKAESAPKVEEKAKPSKPATPAKKTTASKPTTAKKPTAAKTTASKPATGKTTTASKATATKATASKPAPKKAATAKAPATGKATTEKQPSAPKTATKEKADE